MRRNGTEYTIRAFPLGGFVNLKGMQPDDPITPDGLNGRRPAERALVYLAGPLMNVILAVVVFCSAGFLIGTQDETRQIVFQLTRNDVAEKMGLKPKDLILAINGKEITGEEDVFAQIYRSPGKPVEVKVERDGQVLTLTGTARDERQEGEFAAVTAVPEGTQLALQPGDQPALFNDEFLLYPGVNVAERLPQLLEEHRGKEVTVTVIRGENEWVDVTGIAGPVTLARQKRVRHVGKLGMGPLPGQGPRVSFARSVETGLRNVGTFFQLFYRMFEQKKVVENVGGLSQLSLSLAVFNLIPIPILDGGHMLLLTLEVLRRRRLEPEVHRIATVFGLAIIVALFFFIMWKDLGGWRG
jgi:regulator of sigma E protease